MATTKKIKKKVTKKSVSKKGRNLDGQRQLHVLIDEDIYRQLKIKAATEDIAIKDLVADALVKRIN